jgi:choline-sulfatase
MHFLGPDQRHGFEKRPIGEYSAVAPGAQRLGGIQLDRIHGTAGQSRRAVECAGYGRTTYQAFDDMIADAACTYLDERAADRDGRPFAAVAGFVLPHCPFFAPKDLFDYYYERVDVPQPTDEELEREPEAVRVFKESRGIAEPLTEERIRIARAAYLGLCEYFDARVGQILAKLEETGLDRNTLVIYTSDHGEMAGEHGCWWKSNYYDGSVGVPLIASLPGTVQESTVSSAICNLMDLGPTVVEMAGAESMPDVDGHSLWQVMTKGADQTRPDETFSELVDQRTDGIPSRMVRQGPWKLYRNHDGSPPVLFNLEEDPGELNDLGTDPDHEEIREELLGRLHDGWDPEAIARENAELNRSVEVLSAWGNAVQPSYEDSLPIPEGAEDVVIL